MNQGECYSTVMKIAIAQLNCTVGDLAGNAAKILDFAERAKVLGAELLLTPELSICGYPPEDLLLRDDFCDACEREVEAIARRISGIAVLVGYPQREGINRFNAAALVSNGKVAARYYKHDLPNYTVFDEDRYFASGAAPCVIEIGGARVGVNICEDVWLGSAPAAARAAGARALVVLNASPFHLNKQAERHDVVRARTRETGLPVVFCNLVGGQDELVFDGQSFVMNSRGEVTQQLAAFEEQLALVEFRDGQPVPGEKAPELSTEATVYCALTLGVHDYIGKNGFPGAQSSTSRAS